MKYFVLVMVLFWVPLTVPLCAGPLLYQSGKNSVKTPQIAVADVKKIFEGYWKRVDYDKKLEVSKKEMNTDLEKANEERLKLRRAFNELKEAARDVMLNENERNKKLAEAQEVNRRYREQELRCEELKKQYETRIRTDYENVREKLVIEIQEAVQRRCITDGYALVLDSSGPSLNSLPLVIYASPSIDITADILADLNKGQPKLSETPAAPAASTNP